MNKIDHYGLIGIISLIIYKIKSPFYFSNSRLIRTPITLRGRKYIDCKKGLTTGVGCRIEAFKPISGKYSLRIGQNVQMNDYVHITAMNSVTIGDNTLLASKIYISDSTHGIYKKSVNQSSPNEPPVLREYSCESVSIGKNVWIGEFVSILPGVKVGDGVIIGSNSVVTKDLPQNTICVGNPSKPIKKFNFKENKWEKY